MTFKRDDTFSYRRAKSGDVSISFLGKPVTTLRGKAAAKFADRIEGASEDQAQHLWRGPLETLNVAMNGLGNAGPEMPRNTEQSAQIAAECGNFSKNSKQSPV